MSIQSGIKAMKAYRMVFKLPVHARIIHLRFLDIYTMRMNFVGKIRVVLLQYVFTNMEGRGFLFVKCIFLCFSRLRNVFLLVHNYWCDDSGWKWNSMGCGYRARDNLLSNTIKLIGPMLVYKWQLIADQRISQKREVNKKYVRADYAWKYKVPTIVALTFGNKDCTSTKRTGDISWL